ncbi:MAG: SLC13 family permease [Intrasporangium sp.]|uniref:SLC13 family permease n=1 Tax=Intrasporangium sp. TaxID=1925024 RepID=UPI003F7CE156
MTLAQAALPSVGPIVDVDALVDRVVPILVFLVALTVVAEICDAAGLFDAAAHWAARLAGGRVVVLWLLIASLSTVSTILLSLDTTAVLLTPVAIVVARQVGAAATPFAMTTLWLANTGSLLLPVSNLTNLLARRPFSALGLDARGYIALMWRPALVAVVMTVAVLWLVNRRSLAGHFSAPPRAEPHDPGLMLMAGVVVLLMAAGFVIGVQPAYPAVAAALALLVLTSVRAPVLLRGIRPPWLTVAALCVLFLVVDTALRHGLEEVLRSVMGTGTRTLDLLRVSGIGAVSANAIDNLPAYLALEPTVSDAPTRLAALLIGVNAGPLVIPWGSVATILWLRQCRRAGLAVSVRQLALQGLLCAVVVVVAATVSTSL